MKKVKLIAPVLLSATLLFQACKKETPEEHNHEELITTVIVKLTPTDGGTALEYKWEDLDGPGGNTPVINTIGLAPNKTYNTELTFWDMSKSPVENITTEIAEEDAAHRVYYTPAAGSTITVSNLNKDESGVDLGTTSVWTTTAAGNSSITITLRHYSGNPPGKAQADAVNSTKSGTDAEVTFDTNIQ